MKAAPFLILLLPFAATAHTDEKVDAIIDAFAVKEKFLTVKQELKPMDLSSGVSEGLSALKPLLDRNYQEQLNLFNQNVNWDNIQPEIVQAIKSIYNQEEIDAVNGFINSKHGASFFSKQSTVEESFVEAFTGVFTQYYQESSELSEKHQQELEVRAAELEETESEAPAPQNASHKPDIGDIVRFRVSTENGSMIGYRVSPGRKRELFEKSPFEYDDMVLSVNGIRVNEPDNIREAYNILKTNVEAHFQVRRDGELVDFVIDIPELVLGAQ